MTPFQRERATAFDNLVEQWQKKNPEAYYSESELIRKAEFVAKMKLAKKAKRENQQYSLFQSGSTI